MFNTFLCLLLWQRGSGWLKQLRITFVQRKHIVWKKTKTKPPVFTNLRIHVWQVVLLPQWEKVQFYEKKTESLLGWVAWQDRWRGCFEEPALWGFFLFYFGYQLAAGMFPHTLLRSETFHLSWCLWACYVQGSLMLSHRTVCLVHGLWTGWIEQMTINSSYWGQTVWLKKKLYVKWNVQR